MDGTQWFIRIGSDEVGPMSFSELVLLAQQGRVQPGTQVSADKVVWRDAATVAGLRFGRNPSPQDTSASATNDWLKAGMSQARTILNDLWEMDYRNEIIPIDQPKLMGLLKDRVFWFAVLLGIVPLMIATLTDAEAQLVLFALFFAGVWGVLFRSVIVRHAASWKVLLPSLLFTGLVGTAVAGKIESLLLPQDFPLSSGYVMALVKFILVIGVWESLAKTVPVVGYILWKRSAADPMTIVLVGVFSGLGFAAFENLVYGELSISLAAQATSTAGAKGLAEGVQGAMANAMLRSLSLVFCHGIWAGIFAYFLATASFSHRRWGAMFFIGLALTAVLHGTFDWLTCIQLTLATLTACLSFVLFYLYVGKLRAMCGGR